jgi:hypothetical protein
MPSTTQRAVWLIGAFAALASRPAAGDAPAFSSPRPAAVLEAGTSVTVAWSVAAAAVPPTGEMELLLSLDGGRSFPVRLTRDLDPRTSALLWRVPELPTGHARLALRSGEGEEPEAEEIRLVSDEFAIASGTERPLETALFARGEWRLREALDGKEAGRIPAPPAVGDGAPAMTSARELPAAAAPRREPARDSACHRSDPDFETIPLPNVRGSVTPEPVRPETPKRE